MILKINDRIRNRKIDFFSKFSIELRYDAIASLFSFSFYFDPDNQNHKDLACIGHYHNCSLEHNGELLLTGTILNEAFANTNKRELTKFSGYSLPGVLEDCQIPPSLYPLQSDGLSLKQIASKLLSPFKIGMEVDPSVATKMDSAYEVTTASEGQSIKAYLTELATQKSITISHTGEGKLLFTEIKTNRAPILNFDGGIPFTFMGLTFSGQYMHSEITVMKEADIDGGNAGESTISNPYVPYVYRPKVIKQSSGDSIDTELVAKTALAEELKNLKLVIKTDRWEIDGKVIKPNNLITVVNPEIFLFNTSTWFIEKVRLEGDNKKTEATLTCVLPEVYSGQTPKYIFKNINTHG